MNKSKSNQPANPPKKTIPMQAHTRVVASHLNLIQDPEEIAAAKRGELYLDKKPVLICRGIPAAETVQAVYGIFATHKDLTGQPFRLSHKEKSIVHRDQWGDDSRVGVREFAKYLEHFTILAELGSYERKPALIIMRAFPPMLVPLCFQPRYITAECFAGMEWVD